jgi:hypothetical protein
VSKRRLPPNPTCGPCGHPAGRHVHNRDEGSWSCNYLKAGEPYQGEYDSVLMTNLPRCGCPRSQAEIVQLGR